MRPMPSFKFTTHAADSNFVFVLIKIRDLWALVYEMIAISHNLIICTCGSTIYIKRYPNCPSYKSYFPSLFILDLWMCKQQNANYLKYWLHLLEMPSIFLFQNFSLRTSIQTFLNSFLYAESWLFYITFLHNKYLRNCSTLVFFAQFLAVFSARFILLLFKV